MRPANLQPIFFESADKVLKTMFFTCVASEPAIESDASLLSTELTFAGHAAGRFGVRVPLKSGRAIAANFLGIEQATDEQTADVVCELTNMLCGSVLSRLESRDHFELHHPELDPANTDWRADDRAVGYTFGTEEGALTMWIAFDGQEFARPGA